MGESLLRKWLNLPSGAWPPDYFTLLELPIAINHPDEIEERVFVRMERLRHYQITHPEVVSEGMNLLAKALDTLTDPKARESYLASLGYSTPLEPKLLDSTANLLPLEPGPSPPTTGDTDLDEAALLLDPIDLEEIEDEKETEEDDRIEVIVLPKFEPVPETEKVPPALPSQREIPPALPSQREIPPALPSQREIPLPISNSAQPGEPPSLPHLRRDRRQLYRDRVRLRQCLQAWNETFPLMTQANRNFQKQLEWVRLSQAVEQLQSCLPGLVQLLPESQNDWLISLLKRGDAAEVIGNLLPTQRESLAKNFRSIQYDLSELANTFRKRVRKRHRRNSARRWGLPVFRKLRKYPEVILLVLAILSILISIWRS